MRYKVEKIEHYVVIDTEAAEEAVKVHYDGPDHGFAKQMAADMNENHQSALDATQRIQDDARNARELDIAEHGSGEDRA